MKVRMMLPMSVRCNTCGTFLYKGTKFNTRMEDVRGETYLGIKVFRFYFRCTACSAEFCLKTDPKNADYIVEAGATRNYEPWRDKEKDKAVAVAQREEEERGNAMKALENRTLDSKREMDILSALDEMKSLKARHAQVDTETALAALKRTANVEETDDLDEDDEEAVRRMLLQRAGFVKRLSDSDEEVDGGGLQQEEEGDGGRERKVARSNGRNRPSLKGPFDPSVLWEEDGEGQDEEEIPANNTQQVLGGGGENNNNRNDGDSQQQQQQQDGGRGARKSIVGSTGDEGGPFGLSSGGNATGTGNGRQQPRQGGIAKQEVEPPALPKFGSRPVSLVVKKKEAPAAAAPAEEKQEDEANGLLGLGAYGSDDSD